MSVLLAAACVLPAAALLVLLGAFICYRIVFYSPVRRHDAEEIRLPRGEIYRPYRDEMTAWILRKRKLPHQDVAVRAFDGLTLRGQYFECAPGAPLEILFHGYRGDAERDLSGAIERCFAIGHNVLLADQRGSGLSEGRAVTFGVRESRDVCTWVEDAVNRFGPETDILIGGVSMGAATVLTAAGKPLPGNVKAVLADCGYTSARDIILKVMGDLRIPGRLLYPLVRLGARLYGGFDIEQSSPVRAMERCTVPVIFFHGDADCFVPMDMSVRNHAACRAHSRLVIIPGAGHGLCYVCDKERYLSELRAFCREIGLKVKETETK